MQRALIPLGPPGDGRRHGQEWIVRIDCAQGPDFLHVIGPATGDAARLEDAPQRLEPAQTVITKLLRQSPRVEIEPGRLDIDYHAQALQFVYDLAALEIRVRDAGAGWPHRPVFVDLFVNIEQGLHCSIAHRMRRELQARLNGRAHDGQ